MAESPGYRRHLASTYVRIYRPLAPRGRRRYCLDQITARWWTRFDVFAYRHFGLSLGVRALGISSVLLLRTRGRRSGQVREVLVAYVDLDQAPIICGANGGWDHVPAWFVNMRAGGPVEIERHGHRQAVVPVVLEGDERERAFAAVAQAFPHVGLYLSRTSRCFPVVRLEAAGASGTGSGGARQGGHEPAGDGYLDGPADRSGEPRQRIGWPGEGNYSEKCAFAAAFDEEGFFTALRVTRQRAVGEAESVDLVDDADDPAWRDDLRWPEREDREDRRARGYRNAGREDADAGTLVSGPAAEPGNGRAEGPRVADPAVIAVMPVSRR